MQKLYPHQNFYLYGIQNTVHSALVIIIIFFFKRTWYGRLENIFVNLSESLDVAILFMCRTPKSDGTLKVQCSTVYANKSSMAWRTKIWWVITKAGSKRGVKVQNLFTPCYGSNECTQLTRDRQRVKPVWMTIYILYLLNKIW